MTQGHTTRRERQVRHKSTNLNTILRFTSNKPKTENKIAKSLIHATRSTKYFKKIGKTWKINREVTYPSSLSQRSILLTRFLLRC